MSSFSIVGLRSRPDLNGREAVVVCEVGARRKVRVLHTGEVFALKAENLCAIGSHSLAVCDGCAKSFEHKAVMYCARCKSRKYCSKACQRRAWPEHKLVCAELARMRDEARVGAFLPGSVISNALKAQDRLFEGKTDSAKKYVAKALAVDPENLELYLASKLLLRVMTRSMRRDSRWS